MTFRAILFDFDGVLADTEKLHCEAFRRVLATAGQPFTPDDYFQRYIHFNDVNVFRHVNADRRLGWDDARALSLSERKRVLFRELMGSPDILFPGAAELVRALAARLPLAICSMGRRDEIEPVLDRGGIRGCFSALVTSEDVCKPKPDPEPYLLCLERLNAARGALLAPAECVVIEDSRGGTRAGKAAGMTVLALTHSLTEPELRAAGADHIFADLAALERFLTDERG
jgi:beta-phosphoglucomutase-like phosphatase (HAD superfamily)